MASPRELELGVLAPLAPNFPRRTVGNTLTKFDGVEAIYEDITRQPTEPAAQSKIKLTMDVPLAIRRARFSIENLVISVAAADDFANAKLCDLPDRNIAILQAELVGSAVFSGDYATNDDPSLGVGTAIASNATLATTMQDVIAKTDFTNITKDAATALAMSRLGATGSLTVLNIGDGAANALYLNVGNNGDVLSDVGTVTVNGTFDLWYVELGNVGS